MTERLGDDAEQLTYSEIKSAAATGQKNCPKCGEPIEKCQYPQHVRRCENG